MVPQGHWFGATFSVLDEQKMPWLHKVHNSNDKHLLGMVEYKAREMLFDQIPALSEKMLW